MELSIWVWWVFEYFQLWWFPFWWIRQGSFLSEWICELRLADYFRQVEWFLEAWYFFRSFWEFMWHCRSLVQSCFSWFAIRWITLYQRVIYFKVCWLTFFKFFENDQWHQNTVPWVWVKSIAWFVHNFKLMD